MTYKVTWLAGSNHFSHCTGSHTCCCLWMQHVIIIRPPLISNLDFQLHFEGHEIRLDYPCTPADNDLLESGWLLSRTELVLSSFQQVPGTPLVSRPTPLTHITCLAAELCHSISREGRKQRKQESASHCFIPRKVFCISLANFLLNTFRAH